MTPAEKAKDLVGKHYNIRPIETMTEGEKSIAYGVAKVSALITGGQIIEALKPIRAYWTNDSIDPLKYWQQVQIEIAAL
jgi:hypothetical protein